MKLKLFKTMGICVAALSLCMSCYADGTCDVTYKYMESKVIISGTAATDEKFVALQILDGGKEFDKPYADENVLFCDQTVPTDGKYSFEVEYDCVGGEYAARLATNKGIKDTFDIVIVATGDVEAAYDELNESAKNNDFDTFMSVINTKRNELNFGFVLSDGKSLGSEVADYFDYVKKNPLSIEEESKNVSIFKIYITAYALNGKETDNIDSVMDSLCFEDSEFLADYHDIADTEGIQKYFTEKMSGKSIGDLDEFELAAKEALILTTVRYADGSDDVKNVLQEYGEAIGITKSASDSVYRQLSGQDFDDGDALKNRFNSLGEGSSSSNAGNGGSSGGSRGSGSSGGGGTVGSFGGEYNMEPIADAAANETIKMSFEDLDGVMWASEAILALADKGIVNGKGNNMFAPDDPVTREEFTKILVGAMKLDNGQEVADGFADVSEDEWYFRYVNIAREEEIVSGIGDGLFGVGSPITREDMAVMLCNALKSRNVALTITEVAFEDAAEISDYAVEAVSALYNLGAVNGVSETEFMPKGIATRAQAAKVIYGVLELLQ